MQDFPLFDKLPHNLCHIFNMPLRVIAVQVV